MQPDQETPQTHDGAPMAHTEQPVLSDSERDAVTAGQASNKVMLAVLAVIIVVLALMYVWGSKVSVFKEPVANETVVTPRVEPNYPSVEDIPLDDIDTLQAELATPEIDALDSELDALEAELDAALVE